MRVQRNYRRGQSGLGAAPYNRPSRWGRLLGVAARQVGTRALNHFIPGAGTLANMVFSRGGRSSGFGSSTASAISNLRRGLPGKSSVPHS